VTVAIAAVCRLDDPPFATGAPFVIGAADRMLTAGDTELEHTEPKILSLAPRVVALFAGDATAHLGVCSAARAALGAVAAPDVAAAADAVGAAYRAHRGRLAEQTILAPLGLTMDSFIARHREITAEVAARVTQAVVEQSARLELIVAGVDASGAHLYLVADPGLVRCYDALGFVAIGSGADHAAAHLLRLGYSPRTPLPRSAVLVYLAKKRAEAAPGVGAQTDCFALGQQFFLADADWVTRLLESTYRTIQASEQAVLDRVTAKVAERVREYATHARPAGATAVA
jgi:hypothetical protein